MDAPAGVVLREGQGYNPYFPGGAISMAQVLYDEVCNDVLRCADNKMNLSYSIHVILILGSLL